ncbi:MAG: hypothetical protein MJ252_06870 [archaeon]|nr:hypothetical protein [archaeon]
MSSILLTWLNTEVDLSKKIKNMEEDFANGYLLGELLHKFNQLTNMDEFRNDNSRESQIRNFDILHQVLSNVGVKFTPQTAKNIMNKKPGVVSNLLYEIRSNLEKKGVNPDNISLKKSSHFQEMYAPMKFKQDIPKYTSFENRHFLETLQRNTRSQKEIDLEKKLKKFEDFKISQDKKIKEAILKEQFEKKKELEDNIKNHRNKNQRYHAFLQQFEEKGINNWKTNMLKAKEREMKDIKFQLTQAEKITKNLERNINATVRDYKRKVDTFEANFGPKKKKKANKGQTPGKEFNNDEFELNQELEKLGAEEVDLNGGVIDNHGKVIFENVEKKAEAIKNAIYGRIMLDHRTKTERNRRRRKIIVEQGKAQLEIENLRREQQYISKLAKQSNQEKQLTYEVYRVNQCKKIIMENRELRENKYKEREEQNVKFSQINESKFLELEMARNQRELEKEDGRKKDLEISLKQKNRNKNSEFCLETVKFIIDITNEAYKFQQTNDVDKFDERVWREWTNLFVNNLPLHDEETNKQEPLATEEIEMGEKESNKINESNLEGEKKEEGAAFKEGEVPQSNEAQGQSQPQQNEAQPQEGNISKMENSHLSEALKSKYGNTFYSIFNPTCQSSKKDQILDECEFSDYVNYLGQWNKDTVLEELNEECKDSLKMDFNFSKTLTPEDITFDYVAPVADSGGAKNVKGKADNKGKSNAKDGTDDLFKCESPENLTIPEQNIRNELFGDLIDILIDMRYDEETKAEEEKKLNAKNVFRYIPIKIAILGQDFSGKRTQAKILSENFPFKIYDVQDLVTRALDLLNSKGSDTQNNFRITNPIVDALPTIQSGSGKEEKKSAVEKMREEQEKEEKKYAKVKELATSIRSLLLKGESITEDIYAELLVEFIKIDFPPKEDYEVKKEIINRVERIQDIQDAMEENKEKNAQRPNAFAIEDKKLNDALMRINLEATKGFVVVNFPCNYKQASALENLLSGYVSKLECHQSAAEKLKEIFNIILEHSPKVYPPEVMVRGGFDIMFYLNVPSTECIRRACGRRQYYDKETKDNIIYHLEDNKPPITSDICENMKPMNDIKRSESALVTRHLAFSQSIDKVVKFYEPFGFEDRKVKTFYEINGNQGIDYVTQDLIEIVNGLVQYNDEKDKEIYEKHEEEDSANEEEEEGEGEISGINEEGNLEGDLMPQEEKKEDKKDEPGKNVEPKKEEQIKEHPDENNPEEEEKAEEINIQKEIEEPEDEYTLYVKKMEEIKSALNKDLSEVLLKIWTKLFENYVSECKSVFKFLRMQREEISEKYKLMCEKFIMFLKRPSKKQILLLDYQMDYNKFLDDYPDLKDEPQVKEEHHQKVDDLNDKIYEIIETRKNEAVEERKKIMTSGWIENEMEKFYMALERLFQNEIDKFISSMQIIRDYYHNLDNRPLVELPFSTIEIIKEEVDPTPIEEFSEDQSKHEPEKYPRIEKLYKTSLKAEFQYEEAIKNSEKERLDKLNEGNKNKPAAKGKKGAPQQSQPDEPKETDYPHNEELKQALANEKAKFKYRITLLKFWGVKYLFNMRRLSLSVYDKLEDWIILAIKAENEALTQLTAILKENIENEAKIKYELALDTFDVVINEQIQNYLEYPPQPMPPKEVIDHDKFNIKQLQILLNELETYVVEDTKSCIRSSTFISIFIKKFIQSKNDTDVYYGIPNLLKNLSLYNYYKFVKKLDPDNTDLVSLKQIGTFFALLNSPLPAQEESEGILKQVEEIKGNPENDGKVTMEQFIGMKFWFDEFEKSETLPNHEDYHRDQKLKEILFQLLSDDNEMLDIPYFLSIVSLECLGMNLNKFRGKTYYEALFF